MMFISVPMANHVTQSYTETDEPLFQILSTNITRKSRLLVWVKLLLVSESGQNVISMNAVANERNNIYQKECKTGSGTCYISYIQYVTFLLPILNFCWNLIDTDDWLLSILIYLTLTSLWIQTFWLASAKSKIERKCDKLLYNKATKSFDSQEFGQKI